MEGDARKDGTRDEGDLKQRAVEESGAPRLCWEVLHSLEALRRRNANVHFVFLRDGGGGERTGEVWASARASVDEVSCAARMAQRGGPVLCRTHRRLWPLRHVRRWVGPVTGGGCCSGRSCEAPVRLLLLLLLLLGSDEQVLCEGDDLSREGRPTKVQPPPSVLPHEITNGARLL